MKLILEIESIRNRHGLSKRQFAERVLVSEATLYAGLNDPEKISLKTLQKIASSFEDVDYVSLKKLKDNDRKKNNETKIPTKYKPNGFLVLYFVTILMFMFLFFGKDHIIQEFRSLTSSTLSYVGLAEDESLERIQKRNIFHDPLYEYQLIDTHITKTDKKIIIESRLKWNFFDKKDDIHEGQFFGEGHYIGEKAAISYTVTDIKTGLTWPGVMMLKVPNAGKISGYWITVHNDAEDDVTEKYAIGSIILDEEK